MRKILFVAHDPGGYDVISPVVQRTKQKNIPFEFYCAGPAAKLDCLHEMAETEIMQRIQDMLDKKLLLGVVTGTSWGSNLELEAISLCKSRRIPTISILDYWSNYQARFLYKGGSYIFPDYYIVMDTLAAKEAEEDGIPSKILRVLGHPGLDKYACCLSNRDLPNDRRGKILFLSQPLSALYNNKLGYTEQSVLLDCIDAAKENESTIHVKFHPKDDEAFQQQYASIAVQGNLTEIMPNYDIIIGMNTMGLLHAVLLGVQAISYQPNLQQPDMCITNKLGLTSRINSYQELLAVLKDGQDIQNRKECLVKECIWLDGCSTERVFGFLKKVLLNED